MAGSFRIAEGYVEVTADESAYDRAIDRLKAKKVSASILAKLDDKDARAQLSTLVKERTVKIRANADTRAATTSLRTLTKGREVKVTAKLAKKETSEALRTLTKDRTVTIGAKLDAKAATTALDKLTKERTVNVRATADTRVAADELKNLVQKRKAYIGVDADTRVAAEELDRFLHRRSVTVDVDLDASALDGLAAHTVDISAQINQAAYDRAVTKLDKLTADRTIIIRPSVDTRVAAEEIRNLTQRRQVRIGIDVDTRVAADSIANLTRRRQMTVQARADTEGAANSLRFLTRDRTVNVRTRLFGLRSLAGLGDSAGGSAGGMGMLSSSIAKIVALAIAATPTLASLGQAIVAMGPAAALAAPAILSFGTAFAAIKVGTSGIGDAFKASFAPAVTSGAAAESATRRVETAQRALAKAQQGVKDAAQSAAEAQAAAARRVEDAQRSLADAERTAAQDRVRAAREVQDAQQELRNTIRDVADANRRAAEQVAEAERNLADAQRAARQAQVDLTDARKEAAQDLEDLNNRLADAQLDQRQKVLDLQDAEQELAAVKAKGAAATQEEIDKAQLRYDRARQALEEQQTETQRLQQQTDEANAAGVEGSEKVKDAKEKVKDATQDVKDKTKELKDAHRDETRTAEDGAERVKKAERDVADAREAARQAAVDGARRIADAQRDVADAQEAARKASVDGARQIRDAQEAAADAARALAEAQTKGASATSKVADAMAKLSPNARAFVDAVLSQRDAWRSLKLDVQDRLFAGLGSKFTELSTAVIPSLRAGLVGMAGNLNAMGKNAADAVIQLSKTGQLRQMFSGLNGAMSKLTRTPGQIITALTQISIAASPAFERLTTAAGTAADRISKKISDAFKSGALEDSIGRAVDIAKQFGQLLGDIFGTIGNIMKAAAAGGGDALGALGAVFSELRRITAMPEVQQALASIFGAIQSIAKLIGTTLGAVIEAALPLLAALAPVITELATKFGPVLANLASAVGEALVPVVDALLPLVSGALTQGLLPVLQTLTGFFQFLSGHQTLVGSIATGIFAIATAMKLWELGTAAVAAVQGILNAVMSANPIGVIVLALTGLAAAFAYAWTHSETFRDIVKGVWDTVMGFFSGAWNLLDQYIVKPFQKLYDILVGHSIIPDLVKAIISWFSRLWAKTKEIFSALKNWVVDTWKSLWNAVRSRWDGFYGGLRNAITGAWSWVRNSVSGLRTSISNMWSGLWNGARDKIAGILSTIRGKISAFSSGMRTAFSNLRNALGTIWDGIKSKIASPVKWVIKNVYGGMRSMWNTIAGKISSKLTLPPISLNFNKGGVVPGSGNTDTVPAMLTPGERILSKRQVAQLGGHRGIDAMLGQDHPTRTGGNPTRQQERRREQAGGQHFASGGIVGTISKGATGLFGGALDWAKDLVIGGLKAAARKAINNLIRPLVNMIPGGGFGGLLKGLSNSTLNSMLDFLGNEDKKAVGGPAVQRALSWAKSQSGLPYQWAGNGNPSWDCSGFMSAIESVIRGERPHRRWATGSFVGNSGPSGWVRGLESPFEIGITNAGVGHTAGTLAGINFESSGGRGVHYGRTARGAGDSMFTSRWGFKPATKYDSGGLLQPGATMAVNATRRPERILDAQQTAMFEQLVSGSRTGGGSVTIENITVSGTFDFSSRSARRQAAQELVVEMKEALRNYDRERAR